MTKIQNIIFFLFIISFGFAKEKYTVSGVVKDADGNGLKKVKLIIFNQDGDDIADGKSKGDGEFKFKKISPGDYSIQGSHKKLGMGELNFSVIDADIEIELIISEIEESIDSMVINDPEPESSPVSLPVQQPEVEKEQLKFGDHFFEYESNLKALQSQIDSLKNIVKGYEKKQNMPNLDRSLLELIQMPEFVHRIELRNGTVVLGDILAESDSTLTLQTQIGRLVLKKEMVIRMEEFDKPGPKVVFEGDPFIDVYPDKHIFTGKIKNVGEKRADFVRVISNLFDQTTTQVGQDSTFVKGTKITYQSNVVADTALEPGQSVPYQLLVPVQKGKKVQYHTMDIHWDETR